MSNALDGLSLTEQALLLRDRPCFSTLSALPAVRGLGFVLAVPSEINAETRKFRIDRGEHGLLGLSRDISFNTRLVDHGGQWGVNGRVVRTRNLAGGDTILYEFLLSKSAIDLWKSFCILTNLLELTARSFESGFRGRTPQGLWLRGLWENVPSLSVVVAPSQAEIIRANAMQVRGLTGVLRDTLRRQGAHREAAGASVEVNDGFLRIGLEAPGALDAHPLTVDRTTLPPKGNNHGYRLTANAYVAELLLMVYVLALLPKPR